VTVQPWESPLKLCGRKVFEGYEIKKNSESLKILQTLNNYNFVSDQVQEQAFAVC